MKVRRALQDIVQEVVVDQHERVSLAVLVDRGPHRQQLLLDSVQLVLSLQKVVDDECRECLLSVIGLEAVHESLELVCDRVVLENGRSTQELLLAGLRHEATLLDGRQEQVHLLLRVLDLQTPLVLVIAGHRRACVAIDRLRRPSSSIILHSILHVGSNSQIKKAIKYLNL